MVGAVLPACSFNGMKSLGGVPSGVVDLTATETEQSIRSHDYGEISEISLFCKKLKNDDWRVLPFELEAFNFSLKLESIGRGKVFPRSQMSTSFFILA